MEGAGGDPEYGVGVGGGEVGGYEGGDGVDYVGGDMGPDGREEDDLAGLMARYDDGDEEGEGEEEDGELPVFANEKNKELNEKIQAKEQALVVADRLAEEHAERIAVMREHLKNVQQELLHTQRLLEAKNKEIETEDHMKQIAEREMGRLHAELKSLTKKAEEIQDSLNLVQNDIYKGNERLEQFKLTMNWNQEELEQWALAARQKEEDAFALEKYKKGDESRVRALTLELERITTDVSKKKLELDAEITETQARQIELDTTAEEFRKMHAERQALVKQWEDAILQMERRDAEIEKAGVRFAEVKRVIAEKTDAIAEQKERLAQQVSDNKETESRISMKARAVARQREAYQKAQAELVEFKDEVEVLKNELQKAAADVMTARTKNTNYSDELESKKVRLEEARERFQACKRKLESASKESDRVEKSAQQREDALKDEEMRLSNEEKELAGLKDSMFKMAQELYKLRKEESNLIAEISGAQAAAKNLAAKIHRLDEQALRQQELVYTAEFQIQHMERKVARASGERSDEEKRQLQARIAELQKELDAASGQVHMLGQQSKRLEDDLRAKKVVQADLAAQLSSVRSRADEMLLQNRSTEIAMKGHMKHKEEVMVQHDVLKLEIKKLRQALSVRADEVFGLENRKAQLTMSMDERKREIQAHREVQRAAAKLAAEERHKVAMDLQARTAKVAALKAKFEVLAGRMKSEEGGEEKSQAYFVIKAAQRREELQREGDELDAAIRKCEREIKALVNTLKHLNIRNQDFRASFKKADGGSTEVQQLSRLESQQKAAADLMFRRKRDLQRVQAEVEEEVRRVNQIQEKIHHVHEHSEHLRSAREQVLAEEEAQRKAVSSGESKLQELVQEYRRSRGVPEGEETPEEVAFEAAAIKDTATNVLFTLGQLSREFPELKPTLTTELERYSLRIPKRPPSRAAGTGGGGGGGGGGVGAGGIEA